MGFKMRLNEGVGRSKVATNVSEKEAKIFDIEPGQKWDDMTDSDTPLRISSKKHGPGLIQKLGKVSRFDRVASEQSDNLIPHAMKKFPGKVFGQKKNEIQVYIMDGFVYAIVDIASHDSKKEEK